MKKQIKIGIIGDYDAGRQSHQATVDSILHAAARLELEAGITWLPTPALLTEKIQKSLRRFDALWASPGSPYRSMEGALTGIRIARELDRPFVGT
jgi:CTP synthase (UTP-ammonia lyase)